MATRTVGYGGSDWTNEVLYAADLNDTMDTAYSTFTDMFDYALAPIGSIVAYHYSWADGNSSIPAGWIDCDGSTISDSDSPMNGEATPDMNGDSEATKRFIYGGTTSNTSGGASTHNHSYTSYYDQDPGTNSNHAKYLNAAANIPPYFEIRWIMRIK